MDLYLEDAFYYLSQCDGVLLEGRFIWPVLYEIEDDYDNTWLVLEWEEFSDEGEEATVTVSFNEKDNQTVWFEDGTMVLTNSDGEEEEIQLLKIWKPTTKNG